MGKKQAGPIIAPTCSVWRVSRSQYKEGNQGGAGYTPRVEVPKLREYRGQGYSSQDGDPEKGELHRELWRSAGVPLEDSVKY